MNNELMGLINLKFQVYFKVQRKMGNQYQMPILNLDANFCDLLKTDNSQFQITNVVKFLTDLIKKQGFNIHNCPYLVS